jgi:hypothetical protein
MLVYLTRPPGQLRQAGEASSQPAAGEPIETAESALASARLFWAGHLVFDRITETSDQFPETLHRNLS